MDHLKAPEILDIGPGPLEASKNTEKLIEELQEIIQAKISVDEFFSVPDRAEDEDSPYSHSDDCRHSSVPHEVANHPKGDQ